VGRLRETNGGTRSGEEDAGEEKFRIWERMKGVEPVYQDK